VKKWYKEPLIHFFAIGLILFFITYMQKDIEENVGENHVTITQKEINLLIALSQKQRKQIPTREELDGLIEYHIQEEILYREALKMDLHKNDPVIRRILVQKMKFITNDSVSMNKVSDQELQSYFQTHKTKFTIPGRISFSQIYFNPRKRNFHAWEDAQHLLSKIIQSKKKINTLNFGDHFRGGNHFDNISPTELSKYFSKSFIAQLFKLHRGKWSSPMKSGFGTHLIYIENRTDPRYASFDEVSDKVKKEWLVEESRKANKAFYQKLREKYTVIVDKITKDENKPVKIPKVDTYTK